MNPPVEMLTDDGYDLQFGTNVVGHFYFTTLVMPALLMAVAASPDATVRVVNTSSNAHWFGGLDYNTFKDSCQKKKGHHGYLWPEQNRKFVSIASHQPLHLRVKRGTSYFRLS